MTLLQDLEKRKRNLQQRIHELQNVKQRLHPADRRELDRNVRALEDITKTIGKLTATELSDGDQEVC